MLGLSWLYFIIMIQRAKHDDFIWKMQFWGNVLFGVLTVFGILAGDGIIMNTLQFIYEHFANYFWPCQLFMKILYGLHSVLICIKIRLYIRKIHVYKICIPISFPNIYIHKVIASQSWSLMLPFSMRGWYKKQASIFCGVWLSLTGHIVHLDDCTQFHVFISCTFHDSILELFWVSF